MSPRRGAWWPELDFSSVVSSVFRWPEIDLSYFRSEWSSQSLRWVVDDVLWSLVTVFESLALVAMLCFFFLFCGCTL